MSYPQHIQNKFNQIELETNQIYELYDDIATHAAVIEELQIEIMQELLAVTKPLEIGNELCPCSSVRYHVYIKGDNTCLLCGKIRGEH